MNVHEKIAAVRTVAGMNQRQFAKLIGVAPPTVTRLENPNSQFRPSDETLEKIASTFNEVSLDWLTDDSNDQVPQSLTSPRESLTSTDAVHEGEHLRAFLDQFPRFTLNHAMLGRELNVSRNQVGAYMNTRRFETDVREALLPAISKLLHRQVTEQEVFGTTGQTEADPIASQFVSVPRLGVADRATLSPDQFRHLQATFTPALFPQTGFYAPADLVPASRVRQSVAIEIGPGDRMEPTLRPGYWVLGFALPADEYLKLYEGTVAILTADGEFLMRQIVANRLRTQDILEVGPYTNDRGSVRQFHRADIALLFSVSSILRGSLF